VKISRAIPRNLLTNLFSDIPIQPIMWMRLARLGGWVFKVFVQISMLVALPGVPAGRSLAMRGVQICLSRVCGTHRALRNQLRQIPRCADRALSSRRCGKEQVFEAMCALLTSIFVNRHAGNTLPSGGPPIFRADSDGIYFMTAAFRAQ
jgi:hypothetical protein